MSALTFHSVARHVLADPHQRVGKYLGIDEVVGEDRLGMEACGISALLDVDGAVVERNSHHASELIAPDAPEIVFGPDVGILQRKPVAMNWRLGGAADLLQERDVGQAGALMKQFFRREVAKPEVFPPNSLFLASMPIQHERKKPSGLLFCGPP